jgi:hypothetical protein
MSEADKQADIRAFVEWAKGVGEDLLNSVFNLFFEEHLKQLWLIWSGLTAVASTVIVLGGGVFYKDNLIAVSVCSFLYVWGGMFLDERKSRKASEKLRRDNEK